MLDYVSWENAAENLNKPSWSTIELERIGTILDIFHISNTERWVGIEVSITVNDAFVQGFGCVVLMQCCSFSTISLVKILALTILTTNAISIKTTLLMQTPKIF